MLERVWARLLADEAFCRQFISQPDQVLATYDLDPAEKAALASIDPDALVLAARSCQLKRLRASR
jgi:hypothetical protein